MEDKQTSKDEGFVALIKSLDSISDTQASTVARQFDLIPALGHNVARVHDLIDAIDETAALGAEADLYGLLLLLGDSDTWKKFRPTLPPTAKQRLEDWRQRYGGWVTQLIQLDEWPDDWSRLLVESIRGSTKFYEERRVLLLIDKYQGDRTRLEMSPSSYAMFAEGILSELVNLPDDVAMEIDDETWADLIKTLGEASQKLHRRVRPPA